MFRTFKTSLPLPSIALMAFVLPGCDQVFGSQGAASAEGPELIRQVFPEWRQDHNEFPIASFLLKEDDNRPYPKLVVTPEQVAKLSDSEVVLLTKGSPPDGGHVAAAMLGAYWFTLKEGRWHLARRQDEVNWLGSSGDFGKVAAKPLAPGVVGVFVKHWWSGFGTDSHWVDGYALDSKGASHVLEGLAIHQTEDNAGGYECETLLKNPPSQPLAVTVENVERMNGGCMRLSANWDVAPAQTGPYAEIRSHQNKSHVKVQTLSVKETNHGYGTIGKFKLRVVREESNLVFRYNAAKHAYELKAGRDLKESF